MLIALVVVAAGLLVGVAAGRRPPALATGSIRPGDAARPGLPGATPLGARLSRPDQTGPGRPGADGRPWRLPGLIAAGTALEIAGTRFVPGLPGRLLMEAGYAGLLAFAAANARRTGLVLIATGLAANLLVIVVDGGMPVRDRPAAVALADQHHGLSRSDHLTFLADTIPVGAAGETLSPGDVVLAVGAAVAAFGWLEPAPTRTRRRVPAPL